MPTSTGLSRSQPTSGSKRIVPLSGGHIFSRFQGQVSDEIVSLDVPPRVVIPVTQGFAVSVPPCVKPGDRVRAGQVIAQSDPLLATPIHASISGEVEFLQVLNFFRRDVLTVIIAGDGTADYEPMDGHNADWERLTPEDIGALLYRGGVACLDREGIPTRHRTSVLLPDNVRDIIVHAVEDEPYAPSTAALLNDETLPAFVAGLGMLQRIMPEACLHVAVSKKRTTLLRELESRVSGLPDVRVYGLTPRYPQGVTPLLSRCLLNRELPPGGQGADVGLVPLELATVLHVYEAVAEGKPLIDRIVALSGGGFSENLHARIRVGTPLKTLLKDRTNRGVHRLVRNSVLTGETITNPLTPVDRTFSQIVSVPEGNKRQPLPFLNPGLATDSHSRAFLSSILRTVKKPDTNLRGELRPCIQCGACAKVCPARLEPAFLSQLMRRSVDERLTRYGLLRCMDCNLCSYVCPCKIPVATQLKQAKETLLV